MTVSQTEHRPWHGPVWSIMFATYCMRFVVTVGEDAVYFTEVYHGVLLLLRFLIHDSPIMISYRLLKHVAV